MRHLFHLLLVLSLSLSYCVTDGDEPAKAPETKKKGIPALKAALALRNSLGRQDKVGQLKM